MAVTVQPFGIGSAAYPFYIADYADDPKPTPTTENATLYVLATRQTFVWRSLLWCLVDDKLALAVSGAVDARTVVFMQAALAEMRGIRTLLAAWFGVPNLFGPLPTIDGNVDYIL